MRESQRFYANRDTFSGANFNMMFDETREMLITNEEKERK